MESRRWIVCLLLVSSYGLSSRHAFCAAESESLSIGALKQMSIEELMNLDVTSVSKQPEPYGRAPAAIQVITHDEIRRSAASSIPEALRLADNLDIAQVNSHDWAISARGFNAALGNKLLVMIDGRSVYSPLFSGVFWNVQDYLLEDIDRIEVISGSGGTLWGANAVNGVINISSKSAKDTQGLYLETGGGEPELKSFAGVRYGGTLAPDVFFRAYGKYFDRGNEVYAAGNNASDSWNMRQGGFRIDSYRTPGNVLTVQGDLYGSDLNVAAGGSGNTAGRNLLGRWSHVISADSNTTLQVYYDRTRLVDPITNQFGTAEILTDDLDTYDLDFQQHIRLNERNRIAWGLGYRFTHDVVEQAQNLAFLPPTLNRNLYSGFVQDEVMLVKNLFFTLGTKLEHNDYTGFEWEPSGRLQWDIAADQMLWSAVSRAVRTPSRVDSDTREPNSSTPILTGNSDFRSEILIAYELGYRARLGSKASASLSTFYNDYTKVRSLNVTPDTLVPLYFGNDLAGDTYGAELSADYQVLERWRLHGGYDLLKENIHVKAGGFDYDHALDETEDPQHQFFLRSSVDLPRNIELDGALRWVDKLIANNDGLPATVPSYFELDIHLGWHPVPKLEFAIAGQNLLHNHHPEYGAPIAIPNRVEIQRSVYGKFSYGW
jgi:iron complex outermembrane receptor protein